MMKYLRFLTTESKVINTKAFTRTGENDRLGLSKKTPDYEEAKDKETELEE